MQNNNNNKYLYDRNVCWMSGTQTHSHRHSDTDKELMINIILSTHISNDTVFIAAYHFKSFLFNPRSSAIMTPDKLLQFRCYAGWLVGCCCCFCLAFSGCCYLWSNLKWLNGININTFIRLLIHSTQKGVRGRERTIRVRSQRYTDTYHSIPDQQPGKKSVWRRRSQTLNANLESGTECATISADQLMQSNSFTRIFSLHFAVFLVVWLLLYSEGGGGVAITITSN